MRGFIIAVLCVVAAALQLGCESDKMARAAEGATFAPEPGRALVVFMRPSGFGGAIQASVYDTSTPRTEFLGIVSTNTKCAYQSPPGQRQFMVVSEAADFLRATLDAGKTYYVLVTPRMGFWKARFSLKAVTADKLDTGEFKDWLSATHWIVNTDASRAWWAENQSDVEQKRAEYFPKWAARSDEDLAEHTLRATDGR